MLFLKAVLCMRIYLHAAFFSTSLSNLLILHHRSDNTLGTLGLFSTATWQAVLHFIRLLLKASNNTKAYIAFEVNTGKLCQHKLEK